MIYKNILLYSVIIWKNKQGMSKIKQSKLITQVIFIKITKLK